MAPSEKVALGRELETLERPRAEERRLEGNRRGGQVAETVSATSGSVEQTRVRHIVGEAVGMSGPTYQRAKAVVDTLERRSSVLPSAPLARSVARSGPGNNETPGLRGFQ